MRETALLPAGFSLNSEFSNHSFVFRRSFYTPESLATCWVAFYVWIRGEDDSAPFFPTWILWIFAFLCSVHLFFLLFFLFLEGNIKWHAREMKWAPSFVKKIFFPLAFVMLVNFSPFFFPPFLFNSARSLPNGERNKKEPAKKRRI